MFDRLANSVRMDDKLSIGRGEVFDSEDFFIPHLCAPHAVFFLVLFTELVAFVLTLAGSRLSDFDWSRAGLISLMCQWVALSSAAVICAIRPRLVAMRVALGGMIAYLVVIVVTLIFSVLGFVIMSKNDITAELSGMQTPMDVLTPVLVAAVIAGMVFRYFWLQAGLRAKQQAYLMARLNALQARIHPHFLFNTLNSIASLIASDPKAAERAVIDLSALMRANLQQSTLLGSVKEEIALCEGYLRIEKLRMGNRLTVNWVVSDDVGGCVMPPLLLQPLLENAVYHGIQQIKSTDPRPIDIRLWREDERQLCIKVTNGVDEHNQVKGHQIALQNISDRLSALFGAASKIEISKQNGIFEVSISYPAEVYEKTGTA